MYVVKVYFLSTLSDVQRSAEGLIGDLVHNSKLTLLEAIYLAKITALTVL